MRAEAEVVMGACREAEVMHGMKWGREEQGQQWQQRQKAWKRARGVTRERTE